jgi:hypothetical protein
MYSTRDGFIRCSKANSPVGDHHSEDSLVKWEISSALTVENGSDDEEEEAEDGDERNRRCGCIEGPGTQGKCTLALSPVLEHLPLARRRVCL